MKTQTASDFYGSKVNLAKVLGITKGAVTNWGDLVPKGVAYKLQVITGGRLQVDESLYVKVKK